MIVRTYREQPAVLHSLPFFPSSWLWRLHFNLRKQLIHSAHNCLVLYWGWLFVWITSIMNHTDHELAFWFPKVMPPPPPHPFTSPNLTLSCDSGSLHSSLLCSGLNIPVRSHVESGPCSGHYVCLPLSDQWWFTAQQMPNFLTVCQSCVFITQTK